MPDGRVSRHHARIAGRRGTLVYADLGSTNGSRVNGVRVGELVLGAGDRIELGDTVIVVEVAGDVTLMDGFLLVIWVVRLLFLALLYLFLARVVRSLLRDLRAAGARARRVARSAHRRRVARRRAGGRAGRSTSTPSRRSVETSTTRS